MKRLTQDWVDKLTDEEKQRYESALESDKKCEALKADILNQCRQQDFTLQELEMLIRSLKATYEYMMEKSEEITKVSLFRSTQS